jgi:hypothetical protein
MIQSAPGVLAMLVAVPGVSACVVTNPDKVIVIGGFSGIDDVAPLVGAGSSTGVPEPSGLTLLAGALLALAVGVKNRVAVK